MSIDLSVVIHPSKKLQILAMLFSICLILIGIHLACFSFIPIYLKIIFATSCFIAALFNFFVTKAASRNRWRVLINGRGEIRCQRITGSGEPSSNSDVFFKQSCYLVSGTVIWSQLLLLRLRTLDDDNMINLMILSDAVSSDEFRRLSIACRWIVAQTNSVWK